MELTGCNGLTGQFTDTGDLKISLQSKKLRSGKCQAKFFARSPDSRSFYGYALVESNESLRKVVSAITETVKSMHAHADHRHMHLYAIKRASQSCDIIVYET